MLLEMYEERLGYITSGTTFYLKRDFDDFKSKGIFPTLYMRVLLDESCGIRPPTELAKTLIVSLEACHDFEIGIVSYIRTDEVVVTKYKPS